MFQRSHVGAFKGIHPKLAGVGITNIVLGVLFVSYYNVLVCWGLIYLYHAVTKSVLPWSKEG